MRVVHRPPPRRGYCRTGLTVRPGERQREPAATPRGKRPGLGEDGRGSRLAERSRELLPHGRSTQVGGPKQQASLRCQPRPCPRRGRRQSNPVGATKKYA